jgi:tetratricopeptide (TPR) repeat protein
LWSIKNDNTKRPKKELKPEGNNMAKRIIIISSGPIFIALVIVALVFVGIGHGQPVSIESAQAQVFSFIEGNKWDEADAAVDKILTDYAGNENLPSVLSDFADTYCWHRKYDGAERMYRFIIDKSYDSVWTTKANLNLSRIEIVKLIEQKKFSKAKELTDYMVADFRDEPNLPVALFHIGQEFGWQRSYPDSKRAFDLIIELFPSSPRAAEVRLWSARANICSLIIGKKVKDEEIIAAIDKLLSDFEGDSRLADTLFWISREYEWTRGTSDDRTEWYNAPNSIYERLMGQFKYGQAEWDYKRLNHRMKIFNLLKGADSFDSAQDWQNAVDTAIEEMIEDLNERPEVAGELYWIACGYEEQEKSSLAKEIYGRIIAEFPDTAEADNAVLDNRRLDIWESIKAGNQNEANILTDEFIADFNHHPYSGECLSRVSLKCFQSASYLKKQQQFESAKDYYSIAQDLWLRIIQELPCNLAESYYAVAACCQQRGDWDGAVEYYQKVVDEFPDYKYAGGSQCAVGWCFEVLRDSNQIPKEIVNPMIENAFVSVLTNYPDCYVADYAAYQLADMCDKKGDNVNAISYYKKFLELANPANTRIKIAEGRIAELEGTNK